LKIAICDDDVLFLEFMKKELKEVMTLCGVLENGIDVFESGEELLMREYLKYDIVILDMEMKKLDGYEVAKKLRKDCPEQVLAFCSGVQMPLPEYFEVQPYRYLIKQNKMILHEKLCEVVNKAKEKENDLLLDVLQSGKVHRIPINTISYICRAKHGSKICLLDGSEAIMINKKLEDIYQRLVQDHFVFAHNSYIVNLGAVVKIERSYLVLMNNEELTISRAYSKSFRHAFMTYIGMSFIKEK